jgi:ATP-dependent Lon protease
MLRKDIVKTVEDSKFHIYSVKTIDQGIEILTEVEAGEKGKDGTFKEGTVNFMVDKQLRELASGIKEFEAGEEKPSKKRKK